MEVISSAAEKGSGVEAAESIDQPVQEVVGSRRISWEGVKESIDEMGEVNTGDHRMALCPREEARLESRIAWEGEKGILTMA